MSLHTKHPQIRSTIRSQRMGSESKLPRILSFMHMSRQLAHTQSASNIAKQATQERTSTEKPFPISYSEYRMRGPQLRPTKLENAEELEGFFEKYSRTRQPANCSQSHSKQYSERQLMLQSRTVDPVKVQNAEFTPLEKSVLDKIEENEEQRTKLVTWVDRQRRRKIHRLLNDNRREAIRAVVNTSLYMV